MRVDGTMLLIPLPNGREWVVVNPLRYHMADGRTTTVPGRFITDLVSRPWATAALVDIWGKHGPWAIKHDRDYWVQDISRKQADEDYLAGMEFCGVSMVKRRAIWSALRIGGWFAWWKNDRRKRRGESALYAGDLSGIPTQGFEQKPPEWPEGLA